MAIIGATIIDFFSKFFGVTEAPAGEANVTINTGTPVDTGTANAEGDADSLARANHIHKNADHDHTGDAGDGGKLDHGGLLGLADPEDHTAYLLSDGTRELTDNLAVTATKTIDGVDISAHDVATTGVHGAGVDTIATDADITTHAGVAAAHHARYTDAEAVAAVGPAAPADADYLVATPNAVLTNEIVVGNTPGGELGGTWGAPTVDAFHSGSAHHAHPLWVTEVRMHFGSAPAGGFTRTITG